MNIKHLQRRRLAAVLAAASFTLAACGSDDDPSAADPAVDGTEADDSADGTASDDESGDDGSAEGTVADGAATSEAPGEPSQGGEATVVHISNPSSLDPVTGGSGNDHHSLYPFFDTLISFDPATLEAKPGLAESWEYPDPRTLVLTLQPGVEFHDGTPLDAEAVTFNLDRALTSDLSTVKADLSMIESVEATGDLEVTIHLNRDDSSLVLILADRPGMMSSPTAIEELGEEYARNPVGTGPFKFVEWLPNDRLVGERFDAYRQEGLPHLDQLTIRYIADQQTAVNALIAGEADVLLKVAAADVERLEGTDDVSVVEGPSLGLETCYFNFSRPPFDSKEARLAASYAINREALNELYTFGRATPAHEVYPPGYWAASEERGDFFDYDPDRARELLAEAGFADGVSIKGIAYDASGQARKVEIVQAQLAEVGIDMQFDVMEVGIATSTFFEDLTYDLYCAGWSGRPDPSQTALSLFGADAFYNAGNYASPGMEAALDAAGAVTDLEERATAFEQVVELSQEDALFIPLLHQADITAHHSTVGGVQPNLYGKVDVSTIWVEE